jgi:nucleoside-diphosphate-sugar epimerase
LRLLITGTDGYIGSLMAPIMIANGYDVIGLDTSYFSEARLGRGIETPFAALTKDIRHVTAGDLDGVGAVLHLAGLSNDALGQISRRVTYDVNHYGAIRLARLAKEAGIERFVYSSSCSVYGRSNELVVTEQSRVDPQTDYAVSKMLDEREIGEMADDRFSPTFLRNATAYGASPRMRFDLVVNDLAGQAWTERRIPLKSDGTPWRPIVHVLDICAAFLAVLRSPRETVHNQIFNVGRTDENYQVREIAMCIGDVFPGCEVTFGASDPDQRSYRVSFDKIASALPQFRCEWDLRRGAEQLRGLCERVGLTQEMFHQRPFTRLNQLRHLIDTGRIDADFFWTGTPAASADLPGRR